MNKTAEIAIILNPIVRQLFTARKGQGAFYNGRQIQASGQKDLARCLVITEFGTARDAAKLDVTMENMRKLAEKTQGYGTGFFVIFF